MQRINQYQQPIGEALPDWQPVLSPPRAVIAVANGSVIH